MTFIVPTGGSVGIDICDVAFITQQAADESVVWLVNSTPINVAAAIAALVAELNGAEGATILIDLATVEFGTAYVAAQNVARVDPTSDPGACTVRFVGIGTLLRVLDSPAGCVAALNAAERCGGGGTGQGYTDRGVWTPTLTDPNATTVWDAPFVPAPWVRIGPADADGPAVGDYVTCGLVVPFSGEVVGDQPILVVSGFPFPPADAGAFSCAAMLLVDTQPGVSIGVASPPFGGQVFFQMQGVAVGPFAGVLSLEVTVQVDVS